MLPNWTKCTTDIFQEISYKSQRIKLQMSSFLHQPLDPDLSYLPVRMNEMHFFGGKETPCSLELRRLMSQYLHKQSAKGHNHLEM